MEETLEVGFEVREDVMVPPIGDGVPTTRLAHFLSPTIHSADGSVSELPLDCLSSLPPTFEPKNWPLKLGFIGWRDPQKEWKTWVAKIAALHYSTWKKVGIDEAILNSTYKIHRNSDLVLGLAERWCSETKSFIFSWGEATITLEDVMIAGYSVLGSPVFSPLQTDELKQIEEKLERARMELCRSGSKMATHGSWVNKFMDSGSEIEHEAFLALWLSRFVFSHSYSVIEKSMFPIAVHLARGTKIALAPAILASIYRELSFLKQKIVELIKLDELENEDIELAINICSPFQLVQFWAWERFVNLRPEPNLIKSGEPRFARWQEKMIGVKNVRIVLDSAKEDFDWRPYVKPLTNWNNSKFYVEKEMWLLVDPNLSEELQSFARCLRVSELVGFGLDCIEQYLPHRVAMQFGMDQDLPACVVRADETHCIAWDYYNRPISYLGLYIPCRLYKADVTNRYFEWWRGAMSCLQGANDCVLPGRRNLTRNKISQKRSEGKKKRNLTDVKKISKIEKRMEDGDTFSSFKTKAGRLKGKPKRIDKVTKNDGASTSIHPSSSLNNLEKSSQTLKWKKRDNDGCVVNCGCYKKTKKSVQTSKETENVNDVSASGESTSKMLPLDLILMKEANNSPFPPGFAPKIDFIKEVKVSTDEDDLIIAEYIKSNKSLDMEYRQDGNGENLPRQYQFFSSTVGNEAFNIEPQAELVEKIMLNEPVKSRLETAEELATDYIASSPETESEEKIKNEPVKGGLETAREHATGRRTEMQLVDKIMWDEPVKGGSGTAGVHAAVSEGSSTDHDRVRIQGGIRETSKKDIEILELQLEYRVTKLEKIVAKLKAAMFAHKLLV